MLNDFLPNMKVGDFVVLVEMGEIFQVVRVYSTPANTHIWVKSGDMMLMIENPAQLELYLPAPTPATIYEAEENATRLIAHIVQRANNSVDPVLKQLCLELESQIEFLMHKLT